MKCIRCRGTGEYRGLGLVTTDCELCAEEAIVASKKVADVGINKRSKEYKDSIKELMENDPSLSRADAIKLFDETYENI